jgi:hypothetical protein
MWPQTPQFNYRGGQLELVLFFDQPAPAEVLAVKEDRSEFALYDHDGLVSDRRRPGSGKFPGLVFALGLAFRPRAAGWSRRRGVPTAAAQMRFSRLLILEVVLEIYFCLYLYS